MEESAFQRRLGSFVPILIILCTVLLCYWPAIHNQYALDDIAIVKNNPLLTNNHGNPDFSAIWTSPYWHQDTIHRAGLYRPLSISSFALIQRLSQFLAVDPTLCNHTLNILLHAAIGLLLFFFLRKLSATTPTALSLSLLFVSHPIHTEVVAGLVGRTDLLATGFLLAAIHYALQIKKINLFNGLILTLLCLASLLSKESAALMFLIVPMTVIFYQDAIHNSWRNYRSLVIKIFAITVTATLTYLMLRYLVLDAILINSEGQRIISESPFFRIWSALAFDSFYFQKLLFPLPLSPDYNTGIFPKNIYYHGRAAAVLIFLVITLAACAYQLKKKCRRKNLFPPACIGIILFFLSVAPVCNLLFSIGTPFSERLLYLPMIFLTIACLNPIFCTSKAPGLWSIRPIYLGIAITIVTISILPVRDYAARWRDNLTLFSQATVENPNNYILHAWFGSSLVEVKDYPAAREQALLAIQLNPRSFEAFNLLGSISMKEEKPAEAFQYALKAYDFAPPHEKLNLLYNLYYLALHLNRIDEAQRFIDQLLNVDPNHLNGLLAQGDLQVLAKKYSQAKTTFEKILKLDPKNSAALKRLQLLNSKL
jgi:Flp pilus assembly protein TadD